MLILTNHYRIESLLIVISIYYMVNYGLANYLNKNKRDFVSKKFRMPIQKGKDFLLRHQYQFQQKNCVIALTFKKLYIEIIITNFLVNIKNDVAYLTGLIAQGKTVNCAAPPCHWIYFFVTTHNYANIAFLFFFEIMLILHFDIFKFGFQLYPKEGLIFRLYQKFSQYHV